MSLFGGEDSPQHLSPENEFPDSSALPASPDPSSPADSEYQSAEPLFYDTFNDDDEDYIDESEEELGPDEESARPNRFVGKPSTWKRYTATDRQIAASLEQIQSGNLAAHLYNAHALKRRVRRPVDQLATIKDWQGRDKWQKNGQDLEFTDVLGEVQTELVPTKRWVAWPLAPRDIPTLNDKFGRRWAGKGETTNIVVSDGQTVGEELREEVLAVFLRLAKENWHAREPADASGDELDGAAKSRSMSRSESVRTERSQQDGSDLEMQDEGVDKADDDSAVQSGSENKWAHIISSRKHDRRSQPPYAKPAILTDDDKARRILQPTIHSLLGQLDSLASGIQRTRLNHFGRGVDSATSGSEYISDVEAVGPTSRSQSRPRPQSASGKQASSQKASHAPSLQPSSSSKVLNSRRKGRPLHDDTGSASEWDAELNPEEDSASDSSRTRRLKRKRSNSQASLINNEADPATGLIDWSEVLGIASMTGWNTKAVARTAQRCAELFGEGMAFRAFDENLAGESIPELVHYAPSVIPGPDILGLPSTATTKRPYFEAGTLRCPYPDCPHHHEDKRIPYRVIEHVIRVHGYDPRTNNEDNEERNTHGGVHIDGFLQPVTPKWGWLGNSRPKSRDGGELRRKRKVKHENEEVPPDPGTASPA